MKFYTNLYPIKFAFIGPDDMNKVIPAGTVFTIDGINCNGFDLKTASDIGANVVNATPEMLKIGFTETDYIE